MRTRPERWTGLTCLVVLMVLSRYVAAQSEEPAPLPPPDTPPVEGPADELPPPPPPPAALQPAGEGQQEVPAPGQPWAYPPGGQPGAAPPGYGSPQYYGYGPPPPPPPVPPHPVKEGIHLHDGFFLRLALGGGTVHVQVEPQRAAPGKTELSGSTVNFEFAAGGTPVDGFVLGGRLIASSAPEPEVDFRGATSSPDGAVAMSLTQFFVDIYPMPKEGLHLLGAFGVATISYKPNRATSPVYINDAAGYSASVGAGWEGWIGDQWSLGGLLQLTWMGFNQNVELLRDTDSGAFSTLYDDDASITAFSPTLSVTATFH